MKKFRLLLLDANGVIELFRLGIWEHVVERCDVHVSRSVADIEAHFYEDEHGERQDFDLAGQAETGTIRVFDVAPSDLDEFRARFDPVYFEKLDPGETESLAFMLNSGDEWLICSADKIVFRILGTLHRVEQGVSLEEILTGIGLGRSLRREFSRAYREKWTRKGFAEGLQGVGLKGT